MCFGQVTAQRDEQIGGRPLDRFPVRFLPHTYDPPPLRVDAGWR